jgi:hypothetical protein
VACGILFLIEDNLQALLELAAEDVIIHEVIHVSRHARLRVAARLEAGSHDRNAQIVDHPAVGGMPILEVERAKSIVLFMCSMRPGFARVDNELYYDPQCMMPFGDA